MAYGTVSPTVDEKYVPRLPCGQLRKTMNGDGSVPTLHFALFHFTTFITCTKKPFFDTLESQNTHIQKRHTPVAIFLLVVVVVQGGWGGRARFQTWATSLHGLASSGRQTSEVVERRRVDPRVRPHRLAGRIHPPRRGRRGRGPPRRPRPRPRGRRPERPLDGGIR